MSRLRLKMEQAVKNHSFLGFVCTGQNLALVMDKLPNCCLNIIGMKYDGVVRVIVNFDLGPIRANSRHKSPLQCLII